MNAPLTREQLARLSSDTLAYHGQYVEGLGDPIGQPERDSVFSRLVRGLAARFSAYHERRAVLNELAQLSDRDLADIGLSRSELNRVFDPAFVRTRDAGIIA
jgi:uncharacterized protein YjiS (DUF1127 family)